MRNYAIDSEIDEPRPTYNGRRSEPVKLSSRRLEELSYILRNGHTPEQKREAFMELGHSIREAKRRGIFLRHYEPVLNGYLRSIR